MPVLPDNFSKLTVPPVLPLLSVAPASGLPNPLGPAPPVML
jgi:hypothetical protein